MATPEYNGGAIRGNSGRIKDLEPQTLKPGTPGPASPVYWRVEGSLLELTTVRPVAFFTWCRLRSEGFA